MVNGNNYRTVGQWNTPADNFRAPGELSYFSNNYRTLQEFSYCSRENDSARATLKFTVGAESA